MQHDPIVIVSYARTPIGNLSGVLKDIPATRLGAHVIRTALERSQLASTDISEVIMGCVLPAGLGQAPARQAALYADLSANTTCTTLNKVCGSGMKAIMIAHDTLALGNASVVIAGGMESMTNAPYLLRKARNGYRFGHGELYDHMLLDGLEDAYDAGKPMGYFADQCATHFHFSRQQQDDYAMQSFERAKYATQHGLFMQEIAPITLTSKAGETIITEDEHPFSVNPSKIPQLKPVFNADGTITAGNASSIADGAAALTLLRLSDALRLGLKPLAKIIGHTTYAGKPADFPTAPIHATHQLLTKLNWSISDVDLFEVNEAFAVVALAFMHELQVPSAKINIHGGAVALGHPIGASGARILITLLAALQQQQKSRGIATLCIGGGEATAMAVECYA